MTAQVLIKFGKYRNWTVRNQTFTLVKGFQSGKKGNYVTVRNEGNFPIGIDVVKIKVNHINDYEITGGSVAEVVNFKATAGKAETDEQAMDRIAARFAVLDEMSKACINGEIRAMIVTGPPGVGKSFGIEQQLDKSAMFDRLSGKRERFNIVKGAISGIGLFATLFKYSDKRNVLVFDDCDVWDDQDALNILKGALDSGKRRRISWNKESNLLRREDVPESFDFNGSVIFITNLDFGDRRSKKIKAHLDALQSRCHFLDLTIDTERDKMLRIKQVHRDADGGLFKEYGFDEAQSSEVLEFMFKNAAKLREVSLRMSLKIADLIKISPNNWQMLAEATCMKR